MKNNTHFLLALTVVLLMPAFMQSGSLASEVLIFGLAAMGCNLLLGFTGLLSFGQGVFFGLGSYTIALTLTRWPLPMPLALLLAIALAAIFSPSLWIVALVIAMVNWVWVARIIYAQTRSLARSEFIEAIRSLGASWPRILFIHILPHLAPTILVWR